MIAKAPERDSWIGRSLDVAMGLIGFSIGTSLIIFDDITTQGPHFPRGEPISIDNINPQNREETERYLDQRYGQPLTKRLEKYWAHQKALVTGRDVEYGIYF